MESTITIAPTSDVDASITITPPTYGYIAYNAVMYACTIAILRHRSTSTKWYERAFAIIAPGMYTWYNVGYGVFTRYVLPNINM